MVSEILLFSPPQKTNFPQPPLGLAILASVLMNNGYSTKIFDFSALGLNINDVDSILKHEKPRVVGITAMTPTINSAVLLAKKIKKFDSKIIVVLGGPHATIVPELTLKTVPEIDFIIRGEGEETLLELVNVLQSSDGTIYDKIKGLTYRRGEQVINNSVRPPIMDLDKLPFPAFHLLPIKSYRPHPPFGKKSPFMTLMTSRGCPYDCVFCSKSIFGNKYRANSTQYVLDQIRFLVEKFNIKEIKFYDDVFTLNRKWVINFCRHLKEEHLDIPWTCETRVNLVDANLLKEMKFAGCYMISYGVESGNQTILNALNKNIKLDQALKAFKLTNRSRIKTVGYFMIGCPDENRDTIMDTINFAKKLDPDFVQFSIATPYPGTNLYSLAVEEGSLPEKWNEYVYADLNALDNSSFGTRTLTRHELGQWSSKAYFSFYLRASYIWKRIISTQSLGDLKTNVAGLRMLMDALT